MNIKKYLCIAVGIFVAIVVLAIGISSRFSLSNITYDPYAFIEGFFAQWSPALSAAGVLIAAGLAFWAIYEGRQSQEREREQAMHALHDEIHSNMDDIIRLHFQVSEKVRKEEESGMINTADAPFQVIDTAVFDSMRNTGELRRLEDIRMHIIFCYKLIKMYNQNGAFKPFHLELLANIHGGLAEAIRDLETKFKFLPHYVKNRE